jgi:hypothetical protein
MDRQRQIEGQIQTYRQQMDKQIDIEKRCADEWEERRIDVCSKKDGWTNRQLNGWMDRQTERQTDGQTEGQTNRDTVELKYVQID